MDPIKFLKRIASEKNLKNTDRAVGLIWYHSRKNDEDELSISDICDAFVSAGFGKQNTSRMRQSLKGDPRVVNGATEDSFRIRQKSLANLDEIFSQFLKVKLTPDSDSVLPTELFNESKGYIKKVVNQINASYDYGFYDCCAVMCRRLLETLIIEIYEAQNRAQEIKRGDGNFFMFSDLLAHLENDGQINIGRSAMVGLKQFKGLGDLSAHNRRFNAKQDDIDKQQKGVRVACEELINIL